MGVSGLIMVPKKDGGWRPALNLKPLNAYLRTDYFCLPTLKTIIPFIHQGWWGVFVDLSSAYYHLAMYQGDQPWLGMHYDGKFTSGWDAVWLVDRATQVAKAHEAGGCRTAC